MPSSRLSPDLDARRAHAVQYIESLPPGDRAVVAQILTEIDKGQSPTLDYLWETDYKRIPVDIERFIDDPDFLGRILNPHYGGMDLRRTSRDDLLDLFSPDARYQEWYILGALGTGKTTKAAIALTFINYRLTCLRKPHAFYGLLPGSRIMVAVYSLSREQAQDALYSKIRHFVEHSPYYKKHVPWDDKTLRRLILGKKRNLEIVPGSKFQHMTGRDVFSAVVDEANFFQVHVTDQERKEKISEAEELYRGALERIKSRFIATGGAFPGLGILISSATNVESSLTEKMMHERADAIDEGLVKVSHESLWDATPERFTFPGGRVLIGSATIPSRLLNPDEMAPETGRVIDVPLELLDEFRHTPDKALRNFAGIATIAQSSFVRNPAIVDACIDPELKHPFTAEAITAGTRDDYEIEDYFKVDQVFRVESSRYVPRTDPERARAIHIDLAKSGDACGLAMGHVSGFTEVRRGRPDGTYYMDRTPTIVMDFMLRIVPPQEGEIFFAKIRRFIVNLRDMGMPIGYVTADGWQCLAEGTKISLADGTEVPIETLVGRESFPVYALNRKTGRVTVVMARNARCTGKNALVFKVTLDNGEVVRATSNHRWMLRDKSYRRTDELMTGDSLMPLYRTISQRGPDTMTGYEKLKHPDGPWQYTHKVVLPDPPPRPDLHRHHLNRNRRDNTPGNVVWMDRVEHTALHLPDRLAPERHWSDESREAASRRIKKQWKDPKFRRLVQEARPSPEVFGRPTPARLKCWDELRVRVHEHPEFVRAGQPGTKSDYWKQEITLDKIAALARDNPGISQRRIGELLGVSQDCIANRLDITGIGRQRGWPERLESFLQTGRAGPPRLTRIQERDRKIAAEKAARTHNHKVVSIEPVGYTDVYDIEVPRYHNFALTAGVFVHNSTDMTQLLGKCSPPFLTKVVSIDKNDQPYNSLRQAVFEKRIRYYRYRPFISEFIALVHDLDKHKVDHPKIGPNGNAGSKDVSDAVAGVVYDLIATPHLKLAEAGREVVVAPAPTVAEATLSPELLAGIEHEIAHRLERSRR